jgi:hypothetical protein
VTPSTTLHLRPHHVDACSVRTSHSVDSGRGSSELLLLLLMQRGSPLDDIAIKV